MARIPDSSFRNWKDSQTIFAKEYIQEREMLRVANNDNHERIEQLEEESNYLRLDDNYLDQSAGHQSYPMGISVFRATNWTLDPNIFIQTFRTTTGATQIITKIGKETKMWTRQTEAEAWQTAESVAFKKDVQVGKITPDDGGVEINVREETGDVLAEILKKGTGMHTFYAISGSKNLPSGKSIRGIVHLTSPTFGWLLAQDYMGETFVNYVDSGKWRGWKSLSGTQERLWSGTYYMLESQNVKPTKKLSECQTGWILVWSDYDPGVGSNNYHWAVSYIPKTLAGITAGGTFVPIVIGMYEGRVDITSKYLYFTDTTISGGDLNSREENGSADVVLRYVYEF